MVGHSRPAALKWSSIRSVTCWIQNFINCFFMMSLMRVCLCTCDCLCVCVHVYISVVCDCLCVYASVLQRQKTCQLRENLPPVAIPLLKVCCHPSVWQQIQHTESLQYISSTSIQLPQSLYEQATTDTDSRLFFRLQRVDYHGIVQQIDSRNYTSIELQVKNKAY